MKYALPAIGVIAATAIFTFSATNKTAIATEKSQQERTFEQMDLFAEIMARVKSDYVVPVDNSELIDDAINGMLQALDPHSSYVSPQDFDDLTISTSGEYGGLGMEVTMEEGVVKVIAPIDETPAKKAGIKSGDFLTAIDGKSIIGLSLTDAVDQMRGKPGEPITITVVREGEDPEDFTIVREIIKRVVVRHRVEDGIGYLRISQFNEKTAESLKKSVSALRKEFGGKVPGVVLDLRGNPGGLLDQSIKVSSAFLDGGEVVSTRGRHEEDNQSFNARKGQDFKGVPVAVLIDGASASASEIVAGAVQDRGRGLVIGMTSFGKGSVQTVVPLRDGRDGALRLTTARYYTPDGRSIQATGIVPDISIAYAHEDKDRPARRKEADLPNAIKNEAGESDAEEEIEIEYPPAEFEVQDDYQLKRAIEILKSGQYDQLLAERKG